MRADMKANAIPVGFDYYFELEKDGVVIDSWVEHNLVPLPAINYMSSAIFGDVSPIGTFYIGLFQNNYIPNSGASSADIPGTIVEFVGYSEATRPLWARVNTDGVMTNAAARAAFTVTANARLYGGFLISNSTKAGSTGLMMSVARFTSPRDVEAGMTLRVRSELSLIPTAVV